MRILDQFTKTQIENMLKESISFLQFLKKIGASSNGSGAYKSIKNQLNKLNIEIPIFNLYVYKENKKLKDDDIFIENSIAVSRTNIKRRIIKNNLLKYECSECKNNGMWNDKNLSLQLEHKNGINNDYRIENLEFLCPNCHSQTETYAGKKNKKTEIKIKNKTRKIIINTEIDKKIIEIKGKSICECGGKKNRSSKRCKNCSDLSQRKHLRPNIDILIDEVNNIGYSAVGRKYGVSDNTIKKWIKKEVGKIETKEIII